MTNSNKILLSTLLQIEKSLVNSEQTINSYNSPISIHLDFSKLYDLIVVISSAFNIPETQTDSLYDLLEKFCNGKISQEKIIQFIDSTSLSNNNWPFHIFLRNVYLYGKNWQLLDIMLLLL